MTDEESKDIVPENNNLEKKEPMPIQTALSYERTVLSYETTMMAWIRTSTSLISFGFTIYKVLEDLQRRDPQPRLLTPRIVGLMMIGFGFLSLLLAQIQHNQAIKKLKKNYTGI